MVLLPWLQDAADAGCSRTLGVVFEPSAERSTEICAESSGSRDSHVVVTRSSVVELYLDNTQHDFMLLLTGTSASFSVCPTVCVTVLRCSQEH